MAAIATMADMAALATVLSCMGIRDCGNRTTHRHDTFGTSTEISLAEVQVEFGSTSCQHPRSSFVQYRHHQSQCGSISATSEWVRSNFVRGQPVAMPTYEWHSVRQWIINKKLVGNGLRILGRCRQTHKKPLGSAADIPLQCAGYVICNSLQRVAVAIVGMNPPSLWTPLLGERGSFVRRTVCTCTIIL